MIFTPYTDLGTKQYTIVGLSTGGAMLAAGGLAAGGSLLGGLLGSKGTAPSVMEDTSYNQMVQNGQSGNFNDLANTNSTYLADMFSQLGTGQAPSYYQSYQNQALPYQQRLLQQQMFGTPGNRGQNLQGGPSAMGQAQNMAAMYGLNPQQGIDQMSKVNQQYQNSMSAIDQYFAGQGLNTIQKTADSLPGWATGQQDALSRAFQPQTSVIPAQAGTSSSLPGLFGAMGQSGFFNGMGGQISNGIGSLFGGGSAMGAAGALGTSYGAAAGGSLAGLDALAPAALALS